MNAAVHVCLSVCILEYDGLGRVHWTQQAMDKRSLNALNKMLKLAREQQKKNHGAQADMADVSRPTLLRYLLLHLLLSTAIA